MTPPRAGVRTVLVTGAAGPAGRALGAQLGRRADDRWRAVGVDLSRVAVPGFDVAESMPAALDPAYDRAVLDLLARHRPHLLVPTVSEELPRLAALGRAAGLEDAVVLSGPGPTAVAADKLLTMWALDRARVAVPQYHAADEVASTAQALERVGGSIVVKPRVARGGRGVRVVENPDDLAWADVDASWIVQEFAPGAEYSPQVYRDRATGRCTVVVLAKTARKAGRVGNATAVERLAAAGEAEEIADLASRTAEALDLVGPLDMDVRRLADGTPVVLEVNARFGAVSADAPELLDAVLGSWRG